MYSANTSNQAVLVPSPQNASKGREASNISPLQIDGATRQSTNLSSYLVTDPNTTLFVKFDGDSMQQSGILKNALLVVNRAIKATNNNIVVGKLNGRRFVKRLRKISDQLWLSGDTTTRPIKITAGDDVEFWGVVEHVINSFSEKPLD